MCRKNVNRRIRIEQKLLKVNALFKWLCLYVHDYVCKYKTGYSRKVGDYNGLYQQNCLLTVTNRYN